MEFSIKDLEGMKKIEIIQELQRLLPQANAQLQDLIDKGLYDVSNTMQRFHQSRLQEDFIGRVTRTSTSANESNDRLSSDDIVSAKFLTGTKHYTKNQLAYRLVAVKNFLADDNVKEDKIRLQQDRLTRRMFGLNAQQTPTDEQREESKLIWRLWRKLGLSRDKFDESQTILTNIVDEVELNGFDTTSRRLQFIRDLAVASSGFTQEDITAMLASKSAPTAYLKSEFGMDSDDPADVDWETIYRNT